MMTRYFLTVVMMGATLGLSLPAHAQVTDHTDQSEEDWRKSRKKSGSTDIYTPDSRSTGSGRAPVDYKPVSAVERLPSESRRHLMKERAKAIAESDDGDISDATFEPSEAAKSDEDLMRDEKEAWDVIVTDMAGSDSSGPGGQGENKVAVEGVGGGTRTSPRGGSTRTLQEIMDAIKNGSAGSGSAQDQQAGPPSVQGNGQAPLEQSDGQATQSADAGQTGGELQQAGQQMGQAQSGSDSGSADASGQAGGSADAGGQDGLQGDASDTTRSTEPLSPLDRMRRAREDRPATGNRRSASDYLGGRDD